MKKILSIGLFLMCLFVLPSIQVPIVEAQPNVVVQVAERYKRSGESYYIIEVTDTIVYVIVYYRAVDQRTAVGSLVVERGGAIVRPIGDEVFTVPAVIMWYDPQKSDVYQTKASHCRILATNLEEQASALERNVRKCELAMQRLDKVGVALYAVSIAATVIGSAGLGELAVELLLKVIEHEIKTAITEAILKSTKEALEKQYNMVTYLRVSSAAYGKLGDSWGALSHKGGPTSAAVDLVPGSPKYNAPITFYIKYLEAFRELMVLGKAKAEALRQIDLSISGFRQILRDYEIKRDAINNIKSTLWKSTRAPTYFTTTTSTTIYSTTTSRRCLVATAIYDSELSPEVQFLREFRDNMVLSSFAGGSFMQAFNAWYYSFSPSVAEFISEHSTAKAVSRATLYPLVRILHLSSEAYSAFGSDSEMAVIVTGLIASSLIGVAYLLPIMILLTFSARKRSLKPRCRQLVSLPAKFHYGRP